MKHNRCRNHRLTLLIVLAAALVGASRVRADIHHVDASVSSSGNGEEWSTPFKYLSEALDIAVEGDVITVAQGIYRPDETPTGNVGQPPLKCCSTLHSINDVCWNGESRNALSVIILCVW